MLAAPTPPTSLAKTRVQILSREVRFERAVHVSQLMNPPQCKTEDDDDTDTNTDTQPKIGKLYDPQFRRVRIVTTQ
jgi:hypothetical protein